MRKPPHPLSPSSDSTAAFTSHNDPITGTWTLTGNSNVTFVQPTITLLLNGNALVAGGYGGDPVYHGSSLYDPASGTWATSARVLGTHGNAATATLLLNGKVLLVGGNDENFMPTADADVYQSRD